MADSKQIVIPYSPRNWASELHEAITRWIFVCIHRRGGKTTAILNHLQRDALSTPKSQFAFIGPTYKQVKKIAWEIAKDISRPIPGVITNEVDLTIKYPNGSKLFLGGSENIDSFRGISLWGGASDEDPLQNPQLFATVISKCLADHLGYWIFSGTPLGKNHFWRRGENAKNSKDWTYIYHTIDDSLLNEEGETIDNLRTALEDDKRLVDEGEMTQEEFDQEWYCSFEAAIKGAYYAKELSLMRKQKRIKLIPYDKELLVHTVCDLGVGPAFAVGFYQRVGNELHMIDFWQGSEHEGMPEFAKMLQTKPYVYGKHFAPHDIRGTEIGTGETRFLTAKKLGVNFHIIPSMGVDDGIAKARLMTARLWVDEEKCNEFVDALSQYRQRWDDNKKMFLQEPYHDWTSHAADVHRYAGVVEKLMSNQDRPSVEQPAYESSNPYGQKMQEANKEDTRPMRKPDSWGPRTKFNQGSYDSSFPVDSSI